MSGDVPASTAGIYLHIPFCRAKCSYCDFYSEAEREESIDRFVHCLVEEIHCSSGRTSEWQFDTLFIGGGTPSLLSPGNLEEILAALEQSVGLSEVKEFTLEANPGEAPAAKLRAFRSLGVNRLSLGLQSFNPGLLNRLGRRHTPEDCLKTFSEARHAGFDNVSVDLLFNVPGQSLRRWQADLARLADMEPEHISAYSLTVEPGTALHTQVELGKIVMPTEEVDADMYTWTREFLPERGYEAYEISNYARPGRACRHNLHYWHIDPYLGFGPAVHRFDGIRRSWNVRSLDEYMQRIEGGRSAVAGEEVLSPGQVHNESLAFGLRLQEGVSVTRDLGYASVMDFTLRFQAQLERWEEHLAFSGDRLTLSGKGALLADAIAADFFLDAGESASLPGPRSPTVHAGN